MQARVVSVAFSDFTADLARQRAQAEADIQSDLELDAGPSPERIQALRDEWDCTLSPSFYDAWLYMNDAGTNYIVDIWPKPEVCFDPVGEFYGGGMVYEIDPKDFTIVHREREQ